MPVMFSELTIPFSRLPLGAVLVDAEGNGYFKVLTEEYEYFWMSQVDAPVSSGMSDDLMSKTVGDDWMVLM